MVSGCDEVVRILVKSGADVQYVNQVNSLQQRYLVNILFGKFLLQANGCTALTYAFSEELDSVALLLLKAGATYKITTAEVTIVSFNNIDINIVNDRAVYMQQLLCRRRVDRIIRKQGSVKWW